LYVAIVGLLNINSKLDLNKILPRDSKMRESSLLLEKQGKRYFRYVYGSEIN